MFGYVMANKPELKIREFERYKGFYCGLCQRLKKRNGTASQITLTYDMTFLILLLSSLYEPAEKEERRRCLIHPAKKQRMICNEITDYAADMNVLLSYYHFLDDWEDERKCSALFASRLFHKRAETIAAGYPRQSEVIRSSLEKLTRMEQQGVTELDEISRPFGELMSELFVYREDAFEPILRRLGFFIGKYIYLLDAYLDREEDQKKGNFNPLLESSQWQFSQGQSSQWQFSREQSSQGKDSQSEDGSQQIDERMLQILDGTMREAVIEFEKLPLERDLPILRNIVYEGVRVRLMKHLQKMEERKKDDV